MNRTKIAFVVRKAALTGISLAPARAAAQPDQNLPIVGALERTRIMFRRFRLNAFSVAPLMIFAVATGVWAADRPTSPADWPAVKDVYQDYFLIGNTSLSAANFGANVVPGENSDAAM